MVINYSLSSLNSQERQQKVIDKKLGDGAQGFMYTGDQDRYDDCEAAINDVLKDIKRLAHRLKVVLQHATILISLTISTRAYSLKPNITSRLVP